MVRGTYPTTEKEVEVVSAVKARNVAVKNEQNIYTIVKEKVSKEVLEKLAEEGTIKIITPDDVSDMMKNSNEKIKLKPANIRQQMIDNCEVLIEGIIDKKHIKRC